jgi:3-dehydrosphinganine reductase
VVAADVTDEAGLAAAVATLGPVDVLVAAAGGAEPGHLLELSSASLRRAYELNLLGAAHAVRAVLPGMLARGSGHVVLVSSVAGLVGVFGYGGYGPAKAALRNLAEVLAAEHPGDPGVRRLPADTLTPGFEREGATKPRETAAVSALVPPLPADRVARALVRGIERDRRVITADLGSAVLARAPSVVGPAVRWQLARVVRRVQRGG